MLQTVKTRSPTDFLYLVGFGTGRYSFLPAEALGARLMSPDEACSNSVSFSLSLLQGIFPVQELNQGLLHCRQILYQLSHQGRPWMANGISDLTWPALSSDFHWAPSQAGNGSTQVLHVLFCMLHTAQECQAERQVGLKSSHVPLVESCAWVRGHICPKEGVPLLIPPKAS